jgi:precorrin-2 methylase
MKLFGMFNLDAFCTARGIKFFYAFVPEGLDHSSNVACCAIGDLSEFATTMLLRQSLSE